MRVRQQIVRPHRPVRNLIVAAAGAIAIGAIGYVLYSNASEWAKEELATLYDERDELIKSLESLRETNAVLRERVAILERAKQVEGSAYRNVDAHLRSLQDEVLALKEEVAFYRGIVSAGKEKGLNIQTFVLDKEASPGAYRFQLVLTQNLKRVKTVSGKVKLKIMDELNGSSKELLVSDMNGKQADYLKFEFKFFQRIEGRFTLPDGFKPERLQVEVVSSGKKPASVEKSFEWRGLSS